MRNSDLFPFYELKQFLEVEIYMKLKKFNAFYEGENIFPRVKSIDKEKFQIEICKDVYWNNESSTEVINFHNQVKYLLNSKINDSINFIHKGIEGRSTYGQSISPFLNRIINQFRELHTLPCNRDFYFVGIYLKRIKSAIEKYSTPDNIGEANEIFRKSPFTIKNNFTNSFFIQLYDIAKGSFMIDYDKYNRKKFIEVFTEQTIEDVLQFDCDTPFMILFFEEIKPVFENFKPRIIHESRRFKTEKGFFLTKTNYESSKKRIKWESSESLEIIGKIKDLILEFSK